MDDDTTLVPLFANEDDAVTEQVATATFEGPSPLGLRPLPALLEGERAYLVEVHAPRRAPGLLAVRSALREARDVADSVHPGVADVCIRELLLPCDATTLLRALAELRTWSRDAAGVWSPAFDAFSLREGGASDAGENDTTLDLAVDGSLGSLDPLDRTVVIGAFPRGS